ncbi:MAG: DUF4390 domain-containing protein [Magnetococcales bacterium]|nr:DUF4390 domain-containing protein [Magnetococcales bacterium]
MWALLQGCAPVATDGELGVIDPIDSVAATVQGRDLYVETTLKPLMVQQLMTRVRQGEFLTVRYRLRLYQVRDGWLDRELLEKDVTHRLRFHLITERFEMQEERRSAVYSDDNDEAVRFLSSSRELLLSQATVGERYRIEVRFHMEPDDVPWLFHLLHRIIDFRQSASALHTLTQRIEDRPH